MKKAPLKVEELAAPSFGPSANIDASKYAIKYIKVNLDDPGERTELELLETHGVRDNEEIVILSIDKFTFMDKYIVVMKYLEKINTNSSTNPDDR